MEEYDLAQRSGELLHAIVCLDCIDKAFVSVSETRPAKMANESMLACRIKFPISDSDVRSETGVASVSMQDFEKVKQSKGKRMMRRAVRSEDQLPRMSNNEKNTPTRRCGDSDEAQFLHGFLVDLHCTRR